MHDVALDIGGTKWLLSTPQEDTERRPTSLKPAAFSVMTRVVRGSTAGGPEMVCAAIARVAHQLMLRGGRSVGVSFAGALSEDGVVSDWPNRPDWLGFPLRQELTRALRPQNLTFSDDGYCAALGELHWGVATEAPDNLTVCLGSGLGGVLVRAGVPESPESARTLGHQPGLVGGPRCSCGAHGCLQTALYNLPPVPQSDRQPFAGRPWLAAAPLASALVNHCAEIGVSCLVLTGGLVNRSDVVETLTPLMEAAGFSVLVAEEPSLSSLKGAAVRASAHQRQGVL